MIKQIEISNYIYILIMLLAFGCSVAKGQDFINGDFDEKIAKDIVAVEFWAEWNATNQFNDLVKLKECEKYRVDIMANADTQAEYNVSAIPTVIIFDNGVEKVRFNPNIMFQLDADKKVVQNSVDTIILNKFQ
jgi:thioredoxin-related protein